MMVRGISERYRTELTARTIQARFSVLIREALLPSCPSSVQKTVARVIGVRIFLEQELWGINEVSFVRFVHGALAGSLAKRGARIQKPSSIHALLPEVEWR
jgi:hypothetical protein